MSNGVAGSPSRRERVLLASILVAPFAIYALFRVLGYAKYLTLAVAGGIAFAGATVVFTHPRWGLWMLLFYVYAGLTLPAVGGGLAFLVLAGVVFGLVRGEPNRLTDPVFWYATGALMLISVGSILFAPTPALSLGELGRYGKILLVTCLIVQLVRTPRHLHRLMLVLFVSAVATVVLGAAALALGFSPRDINYIRGEEYMLRFTGLHENPNLAAALMCSCVPLGIFVMKQAPRAHRFIYVAGLIVLIIGMFATFSRSVVFPFTFLVVAVVARERIGRRSFFAIVALLALAVLLAPRMYWQRVLGLQDAFETTTLDWSVHLRLLALQTAWDMFLKHPLTGVGIGNFWSASDYNLFVRMVVHNTYLEILVGTGIFGLIAFLMVLLSGLRHSLAGVRHRWRHHPAWLRTASFYWVLSAVSICMSAFFGSMPFRYFIWVPVAAGLVIGNLLAEDRRAGA